jgi:dTDP-4-dehydrorhamnose reductase
LEAFAQNNPKPGSYGYLTAERAMRIYTIGREGQVARSLREAADENPDIVLGWGARPDVDLLSPKLVKRALLDFSPDIVVNPAAYTAVDRAEDESKLAFAVNRDGAATVAKAAKQLDIPIVHMSTDYVFDGRKAGSYVETDAVAPLGVYGRSKLAGELAVAAANECNVILRTSWVYSPFGSNFVRTMLRLASERDRLRVVGDQIGCPTYAPDIANAIIAIARTIKSSGWHTRFAGVTHLAGPDDVTWFAFACQIMRFIKESGGCAAVVDEIATADYPTAVARPANSRLNCDRLYSTFGVRLPALSQSLEECLRRLLDAPHQPLE